MRKNNKALYEQIMRNVSREVKRALNENLQEESFIDSNVPSQENIDIANDFIQKIESIYETLAKELRQEPYGLPTISIELPNDAQKEIYADIKSTNLTKIANFLEYAETVDDYPVTLMLYWSSSVTIGNLDYNYGDLANAIIDKFENIRKSLKFDFDAEPWEWIEIKLTLNNGDIMNILNKFVKLYNQFVTNINRLIKKYPPEVNNLTNVEYNTDYQEPEYTLSDSAEITLDTISILCTSNSWMDVYEKEDQRRVRSEWRNVVNYIKSRNMDLKSNNIKCGIHREIIQFNGITENNLMFITEFLIDTLGTVNDVYIDDLRACIDVESNTEYLEENNPKLEKQYTKMINDQVNF